MVEANYDDAISIHALREEGDHDANNPPIAHEISIHALREEGDNVRIQTESYP